MERLLALSTLLVLTSKLFLSKSFPRCGANMLVERQRELGRKDKMRTTVRGTHLQRYLLTPESLPEWRVSLELYSVHLEGTVFDLRTHLKLTCAAFLAMPSIFPFRLTQTTGNISPFPFLYPSSATRGGCCSQRI